MLPRQQRGRHHHRHLLAVECCGKGRAQRDFGLAETDVAADQAVHRPAAFEVFQRGVDGAELVLGFLIRKARAELVVDMRLHRKLRRFMQMPLGGDLDQFAGDLADAVLEFRLARLPAAAAQPVQFDIGVIGAVARQQFDILDRQKQLCLGGVVQFEAVMRRAGDLQRLQADEAADAVLDVDHEIARGEAGDFGNEIIQLAGRFARPHQPVAQNVLLADDGDSVGLEAGFHADDGQHRLVARGGLHGAPALTLVRLSSLWSFSMLAMRSREPSLHSAITTFLRWACSACTCATTASNTLTELSARSGVKLRPCRAPASTTPALSSGTANGVSRTSAASSSRLRPFVLGRDTAGRAATACRPRRRRDAPSPRAAPRNNRRSA